MTALSSDGADGGGGGGGAGLLVPAVTSTITSPPSQFANHSWTATSKGALGVRTVRPSCSPSVQVSSLRLHRRPQRQNHRQLHQPHSSCDQNTVAAGHVLSAVLTTTRSPTVSVYVNACVYVHPSTGAQSQSVVRTWPASAQ